MQTKLSPSCEHLLAEDLSGEGCRVTQLVLEGVRGWVGEHMSSNKVAEFGAKKLNSWLGF